MKRFANRLKTRPSLVKGSQSCIICHSDYKVLLTDEKIPLIFSEASIVMKQRYLLSEFLKNVFNEQNLKADLTGLYFSFFFFYSKVDA